MLCRRCCKYNCVVLCHQCKGYCEDQPLGLCCQCFRIIHHGDFTFHKISIVDIQEFNLMLNTSTEWLNDRVRFVERNLSNTNHLFGLYESDKGPQQSDLRDEYTSSKHRWDQSSQQLKDSVEALRTAAFRPLQQCCSEVTNIYKERLNNLKKNHSATKEHIEHLYSVKSTIDHLKLETCPEVLVQKGCHVPELLATLPWNNLPVLSREQPTSVLAFLHYPKELFDALEEARKACAKITYELVHLDRENPFADQRLLQLMPDLGSSFQVRCSYAFRNDGVFGVHLDSAFREEIIQRISCDLRSRRANEFIFRSCAETLEKPCAGHPVYCCHSHNNGQSSWYRGIMVAPHDTMQDIFYVKLVDMGTRCQISAANLVVVRPDDVRYNSIPHQSLEVALGEPVKMLNTQELHVFLEHLFAHLDVSLNMRILGNGCSRGTHYFIVNLWLDSQSEYEAALAFKEFCAKLDNESSSLRPCIVDARLGLDTALECTRDFFTSSIDATATACAEFKETSFIAVEKDQISESDTSSALLVNENVTGESELVPCTGKDDVNENDSTASLSLLFNENVAGYGESELVPCIGKDDVIKNDLTASDSLFSNENVTGESELVPSTGKDHDNESASGAIISNENEPYLSTEKVEEIDGDSTTSDLLLSNKNVTGESELVPCTGKDEATENDLTASGSLFSNENVTGESELVPCTGKDEATENDSIASGSLFSNKNVTGESELVPSTGKKHANESASGTFVFNDNEPDPSAEKVEEIKGDSTASDSLLSNENVTGGSEPKFISGTKMEIIDGNNIVPLSINTDSIASCASESLSHTPFPHWGFAYWGHPSNAFTYNYWNNLKKQEYAKESILSTDSFLSSPPPPPPAPSPDVAFGQMTDFVINDRFDEKALVDMMMCNREAEQSSSFLKDSPSVTFREALRTEDTIHVKKNIHNYLHKNNTIACQIVYDGNDKKPIQLSSLSTPHLFVKINSDSSQFTKTDYQLRMSQLEALYRRPNNKIHCAAGTYLLIKPISSLSYNRFLCLDVAREGSEVKFKFMCLDNNYKMYYRGQKNLERIAFTCPIEEFDKMFYFSIVIVQVEPAFRNNLDFLGSKFLDSNLNLTIVDFSYLSSKKFNPSFIRGIFLPPTFITCEQSVSSTSENLLSSSLFACEAIYEKPTHSKKHESSTFVAHTYNEMKERDYLTENKEVDNVIYLPDKSRQSEITNMQALDNSLPFIKYDLTTETDHLMAGNSTCNVLNKDPEKVADKVGNSISNPDLEEFVDKVSSGAICGVLNRDAEEIAAGVVSGAICGVLNQDTEVSDTVGTGVIYGILNRDAEEMGARVVSGAICGVLNPDTEEVSDRVVSGTICGELNGDAVEGEDKLGSCATFNKVNLLSTEVLKEAYNSNEYSTGNYFQNHAGNSPKNKSNRPCIPDAWKSQILDIVCENASMPIVGRNPRSRESENINGAYSLFNQRKLKTDKESLGCDRGAIAQKDCSTEADKHASSESQLTLSSLCENNEKTDSAHEESKFVEQQGDVAQNAPGGANIHDFEIQMSRASYKKNKRNKKKTGGVASATTPTFEKKSSITIASSTRSKENESRGSTQRFNDARLYHTTDLEYRYHRNYTQSWLTTSHTERPTTIHTDENVTCYNCHQTGHKSTQCTLPLQSRSTTTHTNENVTCYNCHQTGHISTQCTFPLKRSQNSRDHHVDGRHRTQLINNGQRCNPRARNDSSSPSSFGVRHVTMNNESSSKATSLVSDEWTS